MSNMTYRGCYLKVYCNDVPRSLMRYYKRTARHDITDLYSYAFVRQMTSKERGSRWQLMFVYVFSLSVDDLMTWNFSSQVL